MVEKLQPEKIKGSFWGFTRHDVALGVAAFVGAVNEMFLSPFAMWRLQGPAKDGDEVFNGVYMGLRKVLRVPPVQRKV